MIGDLMSWRVRPVRAGAPAPHLERALTTALREAANSVHLAGDGLERITARTVQMTRRIAGEARVGDVIVRDPEPSRNREVRWRVTARPKPLAGGGVVIDYTDLDRPGQRRIAWCEHDTVLWVEPIRGAQ